MNPTAARVAIACGLFYALGGLALGGTLSGFLRDQNWYAQYQNNPFGVGYYEFAVNANGTNTSSFGGAAATDVFGYFQMNNLPTGSYTVASWDVWWRSAYAFNVNVPASGSVSADLRLQATMWGYPAFWDSTGYFEFGQTFVATGPISMIYLRAPFATAYTLTVREGGSSGARVGATRNFSGAGDHRLIFGYGDMPTIAGRLYYVRIRTSSPSIGGVIMQMDPRPDFSDPMPGGCLWLGNGTTMTPYPDRDLGLIIMSDDDGLITNLYTRQSGATFDGTSLGQTFIARGVCLISAAAWLADPAAPTYVVRVLESGPGGAQVGTAKRGKPARLGADPEMIVTWSPGECPLVPSQTYYLEITRDGGGTFNVAYLNVSDPYPFGQAYTNGVAAVGRDIAGTIMEEESPGSAARPKLSITGGPTIVESSRRTNQVAIQWTTDIASDSFVEYAAESPPYAMTNYSAALVGAHSLTITGLQPHTMYHFRVGSSRAGYRAATSRDLVACTRPAGTNLLANPGFEEGTGPSPRSTFPGWIKTTGVDIRTSDGGWFWSLKPTNGTWFCQGAVNGSASDGYIYQRVSGVTPGLDYTFSAWVMTAPRENATWKYDVWNNQGRLIYLRLGVDPTGGTNVNAATVRWSPRLYSHRRYSHLARTAVAQSSNLTVFVHMKGDGVEWHNYAVDDCALTHEDIPVRLGGNLMWSNGAVRIELASKANRTNQIEASTNLVDWSTLTNVLNLTGAAQFSDISATNFPRRFYRARLVP